MLTDKELKWLEERGRPRKIPDGGFYCRHCDSYRCEKCIWMDCKLWFTDYKDAAEFEARIAARLAFAVHDCGDCDLAEHCKDDCSLERLKHARLAVEAEMEKKGK